MSSFCSKQMPKYEYIYIYMYILYGEVTHFICTAYIIHLQWQILIAFTLLFALTDGIFDFILIRIGLLIAMWTRANAANATATSTTSGSLEAQWRCGGRRRLQRQR